VRAATADVPGRRGGRPVTSSHLPSRSPFVPSTDYDAWKDLLTPGKVRDGRLHDACHTAATVLLILGVSERVVTQITGWSSTPRETRPSTYATSRHIDCIVDKLDVSILFVALWIPR
jgi:hypothetical protein